MMKVIEIKGEDCESFTEEQAQLVFDLSKWDEVNATPQLAEYAKAMIGLGIKETISGIRLWPNVEGPALYVGDGSLNTAPGVEIQFSWDFVFECLADHEEDRERIIAVFEKAIERLRSST